MTFEETLDLPERTSGPWKGELEPNAGADYSDVIGDLREPNFWNALGYGRSTSGGDPTPDKKHRHLILLENSQKKVGLTEAALLLASIAINAYSTWLFLWKAEYLSG